MTDLERIGKYEVLEKIGEGGFGAVYKGRDPFIKRLVAIKLCLSGDEAVRRRFLREAEIAGTLRHRNIVTAYDFGFSPSGPYLVQEYLSGEDLKEKIRRRDPLEPGRKLGYLRQVALGLEYAHAQGVLHRDIKPGNVRILDNDRVKLLDFGIAKLLSADSRLTEQGSILGTAGYLPPEQLLGRELDGRADVFSFGALAYELLTYRPPFAGATVTEMFKQVLGGEPPPIAESWSDCPPDLAALIARCLAKDPARRFPGFAEVTAELTPIVARVRATERASAPVVGAAAGLAPAAAAPPAEAPPADGRPARAGADTRPILPDEVAAALEADSPPAEPEAPALRQRQEVDSTRIAEATWTGGAREGAEEPRRRPASIAVRAARLGASLSFGLRRGAAAVGSGLRAAGGRLSAGWGRVRRGPTGLRWGVVGLLASLAVVALVVVGWLAVQRARERPVEVAAPAAAGVAEPAAAPAGGTLVIEAIPWGEVLRVADGAGGEVALPAERTTPLVLSLAPGAYEVEVTRPDLPGPRSCRAEVLPSGAAHCRVELFPVTTVEYFRQAGWWR